MVAIRKRFPLTALLGLAALTPAGVWAQDPTFQVPHSRYVSQPAPTTWGNAGSCVPSAGYYNP